MSGNVVSLVKNTDANPENTASSFLTYSYGLRVMHILSPERVPDLKDEYYSYTYQTLSIT